MRTVHLAFLTNFILLGFIWPQAAPSKTEPQGEKVRFAEALKTEDMSSPLGLGSPIGRSSPAFRGSLLHLSFCRLAPGSSPAVGIVRLLASTESIFGEFQESAQTRVQG